MSTTKYPVFTVGHSNHSWEEFVKLLLRQRIDEVADVRSAPNSRYAAQFNHDDLQQVLGDIGISYMFLGDQLGGRPRDLSCYDSHGQVQYDRVAEMSTFHDGMNLVFRGANSRRIALLCTERDPLDCHRTLLVARNLAEKDVAINHILSGGSLESHTATMNRLLDIFDLTNKPDIFRSEVDIRDYALERQAKKVAYIKPNRRSTHTKTKEKH